MSKRTLILIITGIALLISLFFIVPMANVYFKGKKTSINNKEVEIIVKKNTNLSVLANQLSDAKIIDDKDAFIAVGEYKALNEEKIAAGKYLIKPNTSFKNMLNGFTKNSKGNGNAEVEVEVTFNNCTSIEDICGKVSKCIDIDSARLNKYIRNPKNWQKWGIEMTYEQLPSIFIPNTYKMFYDTNEDLFVNRMVSEFKEFWTGERKSKLTSIGLKTPTDAVTLASIVYSEQNVNSDEWPIIAGLYLNRIKQGIKLQSDPTFKFCWGDKLKGVERLLNKHRDIECAYNTYKINGLPPGPICLPSPKVVDAVLNRANVDFIYMCAKPDYSGRHNFAVSGVEHAKNADDFQKWLAAELRKKNGR